MKTDGRNTNDVQHGDQAALHEPQHRVESDTAEGSPPVSAAPPPPADDARVQAEKILQRNHELIDGEAEPGPDGEREVGVGRTVNSDSSHHGGDYASD